MLFRHESKFLKILLFLILLFFAILVIKPVVDIFLASILIAYILYPLYNKLTTFKIKRELSAIIVIALFFLIFIIPAFFVGKMVFKQLTSIDYSALSAENIKKTCQSLTICSTLFEESLYSTVLYQSLNNLLSKGIATVTEFIYSLVKSLPSLLFNLLLIIIFTYQFLLEGKNYITSIYNYLPLDKNELNHLITSINEVMKGVVFGTIAGAAVQGLFSSIIYLFLGFKVFVLLGILTFLGAFVPVVGTSIVWVPVSIYLIIKGIFLAETIFIIKGIILFIVGAIFLTTIDDILRPFLVSYETKLNPLIVLAGIIGGLNLIGFLGIFYGPIILEIFIIFLKDEKQAL
ncbi:MAG: AI-2E family transporter [Candidatus Woesearchaeota archaeon]